MDDTFVQLHNAKETRVMNIQAGSWGEFVEPNDVRVTYGHEEKGYKLVSDNPVSVTVGPASSHYLDVPDQCSVRPYHDDDVQYYLLGYVGDNPYTFYGPFSFFVIVGSKTGTDFQVYDENEELFNEGTLGEEGTYTVDAQYLSDLTLDFSGYHIVASHPVSVYTGHGMSDVNSPQYIADSVPSYAELGTHYVTYPVSLGKPQTGYKIRVLSTESNTNVNIPHLAIDFDLNKQEYKDISYGYSTTALEVILKI